MTGNIALDVVIGLVFIYTLYSLLTTIIVEFVAVTFQMRARNLRYAIRRMLTDKDSKELARKFYETPLIKYLASGRFKIFGGNKLPSYIQPRNFSDAILYLLKIDSKMQTDTLEKIKDSLKQYEYIESARYMLSMLEDANYTLDQFKTALENWFNDTMERASGWYKKNITYITLLVGFILATLFNADTFQMVTQLSKDPEVRKEYVQLAGELIKNKTLSKPTFDNSLRERLLNNQELRSTWGTDTVGFNNYVTDSVYNASVVAQDTLFSRLNAAYTQVGGSRKILNFERQKSHWYFFDSWMNFLGCMVTVIALSFGAPFWFDLLSKIVKIRSSVFKETTMDESTSGKN